MTLSNEELIEQWREGEKRQRELWLLILERKLYFQAQGIDCERRDNAWRNPPSATKESQMKFFSGVVHRPKGVATGYRQNKRWHTITESELAEFE
jgi:hypothetical protein